MPSPEDDVPILDFSSSSLSSSDLSLADKLRRCCTSSGFFYATGITKVLDDALRVREKCSEFFSLPLETKMRSFSLKKGYIPINGAENAVRKPEFHEKFSCGRLTGSYRPEDPYYDPERSLFFDCKNQFPSEEEVAGFERAYSSLYKSMEEFSEHLLKLFALSLNLRDDELEYFVERSRKHVTNLVALQYDVSEARRTKIEKKKKKDDDNEHDDDEDDDDDLLVRPHTDPTDFTCLFFDEDDGPNGLQILTEEGRWIDVPRVPNAMLVNVGDVLMAWTNGEYKSSRHRVVLRDITSKDKKERLSLVWFHCPNYDALIDSQDVTTRKKKSSLSNAPQKYAPFLCKDRTHFQQTERTKRGLKDRQLTSDLDSSVRGLDVENNSHQM